MGEIEGGINCMHVKNKCLYTVVKILCICILDKFKSFC